LGIDKAVVFGGSAGALSALQFAIRYPDRCRALIAMVPATYVPGLASGAGVEVSPLTEAMMKTVLGSDFIFWTGVRFFPDMMTRMLLATDPALVHAASPEEQERVGEILRHILPVSVRAKGLMFDMRTAGTPEPMPLDRIACPVLAVSVRDDLFGTAKSADYIAASVGDGRAVIYPTGGHVWVGHQHEVWPEIETFLAERTQPTDLTAAASR
jgi:pimeloyl-ACP methyl ester carboxylesterase